MITMLMLKDIQIVTVGRLTASSNVVQAAFYCTFSSYSKFYVLFCCYSYFLFSVNFEKIAVDGGDICIQSLFRTVSKPKFRDPAKNIHVTNSRANISSLDIFYQPQKH